jgi:hypothetical protein
MPTARRLLGVAAARAALGQSGTWIYAIDGDDAGVLSTNEAYRPNSNTWTTLTADPIARSDVGAAAAPCPGGTVANGCIYVEDGFNAGNLNTNEAYSTFTNAWMTLTPDPVARQDPFVAAGRCPLGQTGTCIFVLGGWTGISELNTAESFNPKTNTWTTLPNMLTARDSGAAAAAPCPGGTIAGGCIYTADGYGGPNTVEGYNTFNNTWFTETPDPYGPGRFQLAGAAARCFGKSGTCFYAIDGDQGGGTVLNLNEALTP